MFFIHFIFAKHIPRKSIARGDAHALMFCRFLRADFKHCHYHRQFQLGYELAGIRLPASLLLAPRITPAYFSIYKIPMTALPRFHQQTIDGFH